MKNKKTYLPFIILITGLLGLYYYPKSIWLDKGILPRRSGSPTEYVNENGVVFVERLQAETDCRDYVHMRAKLWALDVLSMYVFLHGILAIALNGREIGVAISTTGGKTSLFLHLLAAIPIGILFWFTASQIISKIGMPMH